MTWLDRLFPTWSAKREHARLRAEMSRQRRTALSVYEAADKSRNTADWNAKNVTADDAIMGDVATILPRARGAVRDDWAAASIVDGWVRNVVGPGINILASAIDPNTNAPLKSFNDNADWWFKRWAHNPRWCDMERRKTWRGIQALVQREKICAGQSFVVLNYVPRNDMVGLTLQVIETEQLDRNLWKTQNGAREIRDGIEIDEYGAAVAYWIYTKKHPMETFGGESVRIPAERVLHLMRQDRPRQTHGITRLAPVLTELWHKKMHKTYTILRARFEACGGAAIESDIDAPEMTMKGLTPNTSTEAVDLNGNPQLTFQPNLLWKMPPGYRMNFVAPQTPGGQYEPFGRMQTREIAAGAGLDYPMVSRDFSGNTFAGQRQGMLESEKETDPEQQELIDNLCRPVWEAFQVYAILEQRYPAPGFDASIESRAAYLEADYIPPPKKWIDPSNQANAAAMAMDMGVWTFKDVVTEQGGDWRQKIRDAKEVDEYKRSEGVQQPVIKGTPNE